MLNATPIVAKTMIGLEKRLDFLPPLAIRLAIKYSVFNTD
jgi:hypothetical protein